MTAIRRSTADETADDVPERMFVLVYRVARQLGYSPRSSVRLGKQILLSLADHPGAGSTDEGRTPVAAGRSERDRVLSAVRDAVPPSTDHDRLDRALRDAVLCDEVAFLPPGERCVLRLALLRRCTLDQIAERTGWNRGQIALLLRAGLATVTEREKAGDPAIRSVGDPL